MAPGSALPGTFDLAVVGAGILGLACARAAALRGLRVVVIDRDAQANGASIRNFGFITVTGQARGEAWDLARRGCAIWKDVAIEAGIPIIQRGLWLTTRRTEAVPLIEAFLKSEMGAGCELLSPAAARSRCGALASGDVQTVLVSESDIRVESREAIPRLAAWLTERFGVVFLRQTTALSASPPRIQTSRGLVEAGAVVVCPGDDLVSLFPERIAKYAVTRCKLQMLRLASPGFRLPGTVMSDLSLVRYAGFGALAEAGPLRARLEAEQPEYFQHGIHLIVAQSADGSLLVGDSHDYGATPEPFADERIDALILDEFAAAMGISAPPVIARWTGTYSSASGSAMLIDEPAPDVRIAMVTSGSGASIAFPLGEQVIAGLYG